MNISSVFCKYSVKSGNRVIALGKCWAIHYIHTSDNHL
jgi:hypothetical protein